MRWQVIAADEYVARVDRLREVDDGVVALVVSGAGARRSRALRLRDLKNRDRCTLTCTVSDELGVLARKPLQIECEEGDLNPHGCLAH